MGVPERMTRRWTLRLLSAWNVKDSTVIQKVSTNVRLIGGKRTGILEPVPFVAKQQSDLAVVEVDRQSAERLVRHDHHYMRGLIR